VEGKSDSEVLLSEEALEKLEKMLDKPTGPGMISRVYVNGQPYEKFIHGQKEARKKLKEEERIKKKIYQQAPLWYQIVSLAANEIGKDD